MTFIGSEVSSTGYSENALRFGLMDIKPVEFIEPVKKFGLKFRKITRTFESLKPAQSFAEMVSLENETIIGTLEIPKWFDAEKLIKAFSQHSIEEYEKDLELKKAVGDLKKAERKDRPLLSFVQFMKRRFELRMDSFLESEAERFLRSNFPLSFYNKLTMFDYTYYDFLKILEDIIRRYEFRARCSRGFDMYTKIITDMQKHIRPLLDRVDDCFFSYMRLKKYLVIWNSKNYEELIDPKFLDIKNIDFSEFEKQCDDYNSELREIRAFLLNQNPNILHKELDPKELTTNMFGKLIMLPSNSLNLER